MHGDADSRLASMHGMPSLRHTNVYSAADLGDEYLFYDREGERVHVLNGSAREIYLLCEGGRDAGEVARLFAERYDVDVEVALRDAAATIRQLIELNLVIED
jgi:hypothetical protein